MTQPVLSKSLRNRYHSAKGEYELVQRLISEEIMSQSPFKKGDVVRDKDTGVRYRIEGGSGYLAHGDVPSLHLRAHRCYKTGRRDAVAATYLNPGNLEPVVDPA